MRSMKLDAARKKEANGAAAPIEAGPLFPRLHVSETDKAGPRAPPRNKMALFEQFTVPSHRFMQSQPNRTLSGPSYQPQKVDCGHPYFVHCSPASYTNAVPSHPQSLHVTSSCVTSIASDQEWQNAFDPQASEICNSSGVTTRPGGLHSNTLSNENAKGSFLEIQKYCSPAARLSVQESLCTSSSFEKICEKFFPASCDSAQVTFTTAIQNRLCETKNIGRDLTIPVAESPGYGHLKADVNADMEIDEDELQAKNIQADAVDNANEHCHGCLSIAVEQFCQKSDIDCHKSCEDLEERNERPEVASSTDLDNPESRRGHTSSPSENSLANTVCTCTSVHILCPLQLCNNTHKLCPSGAEKKDANQSTEAIQKDLVENTGYSENNQMSTNNEVSEPSQQGTGRSTDDSLSSGLAIQAIRPRDVIRAVGQQHFWKARKSLLRQQRIFSDQVFELHKLIKVQQLMAETPCTLLDEEMPSDMVDQCGGCSSQCNAAEVKKRNKENTSLTTSKQLSSKGLGKKAGIEPEIIQNSQPYVAAGNDGPGSMSYSPVFAAGGISAWGYPNLGMGQWMDALTVQGRPSVYQPYAGAFPPPFGGFYGLAGLGSPSPVVPFCIPYPAQRGESWEESSSNHCPPVVAAGADVLRAPAGFVPQNLPGACQFVHPSSNPSFYASAPEKNASTGSGASISPQRQVKSLQAFGTDENPPRGAVAEQRHEILYFQDENCPLNSTSLKSKSSVYMPFISDSRKAGSYHKRSGETPQKSMKGTSQTLSSSKEDVANEVQGREVLHCRELRWQSDQVSYPNGRSEKRKDPPREQSSNALDFFSEVHQSSSRQMNEKWHCQVIKAVPHPAVAASQSAAGILLSLQLERQQ